MRRNHFEPAGWRGDQGVPDGAMWGQLLIETLARPRAAAARVLALRLDMARLTEGAVAVTAAGLVLGWLVSLLSPAAIDPVTAMVLRNPLAGAAVQLVALFGIVGVTVMVGRMFGGRGNYPEALSLVVWLNAVMLVLQGAQIGLMLVLPALAPILALAALIWAVWAFAGFVTVLHGFANQAVVLGGVLGSMLVFFVILSFLAAAVGVAPQGAG